MKTSYLFESAIDNKTNAYLSKWLDYMHEHDKIKKGSPVLDDNGQQVMHNGRPLVYDIAWARRTLFEQLPNCQREDKGNKFMPGCARLFVSVMTNSDNGHDHSRIFSQLNPIIDELYVSHIDEYTSDLYKIEQDGTKTIMSYGDFISKFSKSMNSQLVTDKAKLAKHYAGKTISNGYTVKRCANFEDLRMFAKPHTTWCVAQPNGKSNYDSYTEHGMGIFYVLMKDGWENIKPIKGEKCPKDEYGMSLIAVMIGPTGAVNYCTIRWNHNNGGDDHMLNAEQLSQLIGASIYEVCPPRSIEEQYQKFKEIEDVSNGGSAFVQNIENCKCTELGWDDVGLDYVIWSDNRVHKFRELNFGLNGYASAFAKLRDGRTVKVLDVITDGYGQFYWHIVTNDHKIEIISDQLEQFTTDGLIKLNYDENFMRTFNGLPKNVICNNSVCIGVNETTNGLPNFELVNATHNRLRINIETRQTDLSKLKVSARHGIYIYAHIKGHTYSGKSRVNFAGMQCDSIRILDLYDIQLQDFANLNLDLSSLTLMNCSIENLSGLKSINQLHVDGSTRIIKCANINVNMLFFDIFTSYEPFSNLQNVKCISIRTTGLPARKNIKDQIIRDAKIARVDKLGYWSVSGMPLDLEILTLDDVGFNLKNFLQLNKQLNDTDDLLRQIKDKLPTIKSRFTEEFIDNITHYILVYIAYHTDKNSELVKMFTDEHGRYVSDGTRQAQAEKDAKAKAGKERARMIAMQREQAKKQDEQAKENGQVTDVAENEYEKDIVYVESLVNNGMFKKMFNAKFWH